MPRTYHTALVYMGWQRLGVFNDLSHWFWQKQHLIKAKKAQTKHGNRIISYIYIYICNYLAYLNYFFSLISSFRKDQYHLSRFYPENFVFSFHFVTLVVIFFFFFLFYFSIIILISISVSLLSLVLYH